MNDHPLPTRRLAWDRLSFLVPRHWDLARYAFHKKSTEIELEDDYSVRLRAEWCFPRKQPDLEVVRKRYLKAAERVSAEATASRVLDGLPAAWTAHLYDMPDRHKLLVAFAPLPNPGAFAFFRVYFAPEDRELPQTVLNLLTKSMTSHGNDPVPWEVYDIKLTLPGDYKLITTVFQAGSKMFMFQSRLRRLFLWQVSLANIALRDCSPAEWAADTLNACKLIKGRRFVPNADGEVAARRSRWHPFGHADEIARWCYRYKVRCEHDAEANVLYLWCLNCRNDADIAALRGAFGPFTL